MQDFNLNLIRLRNVQTFSTKIIIRIGYPINPTYYYDPIIIRIGYPINPTYYYDLVSSMIIKRMRRSSWKGMWTLSPWRTHSFWNCSRRGHGPNC